MDASALYTQPEDVDYAYTELSKISPRFHHRRFLR